MSVLALLIMSGLLLGIGLGTTLYRRNFLGIVMGIIVSGGGLITAIVALSAGANVPEDGIIFAATLVIMQVSLLLIGVAILYRRHKQGASLLETIEVDE